MLRNYKLIQLNTFILLLLYILLSPNLVSAQISVTDVIMAFKPENRPVHNVTVGNSSDEMLHVLVEPVEVINSGTPEEQRISTQSLIVAPKRFSIKGKGQRSVRILLHKRPQDTEAVYRVSFVPQSVPPSEEQMQTLTKSGRTISLKVLTGVGMLIFAEPANRRPSLKWERIGDSIKFTNDGNINVRIRNPLACDPDTLPSEASVTSSTAGCTVITDIPGRMYTGATASIKAPADKAIVITKDFNDTIERLVIPPLK